MNEGCGMQQGLDGRYGVLVSVMDNLFEELNRLHQETGDAETQAKATAEQLLGLQAEKTPSCGQGCSPDGPNVEPSAFMDKVIARIKGMTETVNHARGNTERTIHSIVRIRDGV